MSKYVAKRELERIMLATFQRLGKKLYSLSAKEVWEKVWEQVPDLSTREIKKRFARWMEDKRR